MISILLIDFLLRTHLHYKVTKCKYIVFSLINAGLIIITNQTPLLPQQYEIHCSLSAEAQRALFVKQDWYD